MASLEHILVPWIVLFILIWLEAKAAPAETRAGLWPWQVWVLHVGVVMLAFALLLLLLQRPWFAAMLLLAGGLVIILINNAKYHSLREPFLFHDFSYFTAAIRHPRLYLPFLGIARATLAVLVAVAVIAGGIWLEPAQDTALAWSVLYALLGLGCFALVWSWHPDLTLSPSLDVRRLGLWGSLWAYWRRSRRVSLSVDTPSHIKKLAEDLRKQPILPDLLVVQSESFFDPRTAYPMVRNELLRELDLACGEASVHGKLKVPSWGANTVRAECAFLTGLAPESWDVHQFNPYRVLSGLSVTGLAGLLKQQGYRTVCVHPYAGSFYQRDQVMPSLGFDHFMDISAFSVNDCCGQYVGDSAVTDKVIALLRKRDDDPAPLFVFVITMENHGPLHLDRTDDLDEQLLYGTLPIGDWKEFSTYLYHLRHADQMIGRLKQALVESERPGVLAWYGDHVPIIPEFYARHGEPVGETDFFVWTNQKNPRKEFKNVSVDALTALVLGALVTH